MDLLFWWKWDSPPKESAHSVVSLILAGIACRTSDVAAHSTIDVDDLRGDEARLVTGQEQDEVRHILAVAGPWDDLIVSNPSALPRLSVAVHEAGAHTVDPDIVLAADPRHVAGQPIDTRFRRIVGK